ncbi:MAG: tetratricopeptide repeat protein [Pyrinomonadaceae bacterium]|nr:tetratricopeptide repeat protein [Pyrinomonadaceae bacterium]MCX7640679.1 tetratricopeptide repeat protein [Pyrinomonadaceae bacterium]MDW8305363.1 tetratricopeptide repeat protein [Acidobacteriota bacterium]
MRVLLVLLFTLNLSCSLSSNSNFDNNGVARTTTDESRREELIVSSRKEDSVRQNSTESPMARPIDVREMTAEIEKARKEYEKNPKDSQAKQRLAEAYFKRAFALTEAAQYRAALGDFRKGLKLKPDDNEARAMHDRILSIFASLRREPPKEGEEPEPLPFNGRK